MSNDIDQELAQKALSCRERITIKILLLIAQMMYPARYLSTLDKVFDAIREELKKP